MKTKAFTIIISLLSHLTLHSQQEIEGGPINVPTDGIIDGVYLKEDIITKKMIQYSPVREADVIWSKRVWESIDLRQKMNEPLYYSNDQYDASGNWVLNTNFLSLWSIFKKHIMNGDLQLFSPYNPLQFDLSDGDQLKYPINPLPGLNYYTDSSYRNTLFSYLGKLGPESTTALSNQFGEDSTISIDGITSFVYPPRDTIWFTSKDIIEYRIKEDWFFDKQRSMLDVRIIGIAPVIYDKDESGQITGMRELYWLYFPHCRYILNNYYTFNRHNDAQWMSYDDLFWKRKFTGNIYKQSNVFDRKIETYRNGIDALYEAEKIKEEIRLLESDVWHF